MTIESHPSVLQFDYFPRNVSKDIQMQPKKAELVREQRHQTTTSSVLLNNCSAYENVGGFLCSIRIFQISSNHVVYFLQSDERSHSAVIFSVILYCKVGSSRWQYAKRILQIFDQVIIIKFFHDTMMKIPSIKYGIESASISLNSNGFQILAARYRLTVSQQPPSSTLAKEYFTGCSPFFNSSTYEYLQRLTTYWRISREEMTLFIFIRKTNE